MRELKMKLIVGLGNPGRIYKYSRHNVGLLLINRLTKDWGIKLRLDSFTKSRLGRGKIGEKEVVLACPLSFMNLSGEVVRPFMEEYETKLEDLIIIYDDIHIPAGTIRIRQKGSAGGHNGLQSIIDHLGSSDFPRLRIGIQPPHHVGNKKKFVLSKMSSYDRQCMQEVYARAVEAIMP